MKMTQIADAEKEELKKTTTIIIKPEIDALTNVKESRQEAGGTKDLSKYGSEGTTRKTKLAN